MRLLSLLLVLLPAAWTVAFEANQADATNAMTLFEFSPGDEQRWQVVNDGVMGGRSKGAVSVEGGTLRFTGNLVTRGGGFTSLRARKRVDLSQYAGLELRVRGGGRTFEIEVSDGARFRGRSVSRRASFRTSDDWTVVRIPFENLRSSIFGQPIRAGAVDLERINSFGLYILDGIDGPFNLEVDWIRTYSEDD